MISEKVVQLRDVEAKHHERLIEIGSEFARFPISVSSFAGFDVTPLDTLPTLSKTLVQALAWYRSDQQWFPRSYFDFPAGNQLTVDGMFEARFFSVFGALRALCMLLPTVKPLYDPNLNWTPVRYPDGDLGLFCRHDERESERRIQSREELGEYFSGINELQPEIEQIYGDFRGVVDSVWSMGWST